MTMEISDHKVEEIRNELKHGYTSQQQREGKPQFVAKCVRPGRIFLSRLIHWIKGMDRGQENSICLETRKDIAWWAGCIIEYNGVSLLWLHQEPDTDTVVQTYACHKGYRGICGKEYFRGRFPKELQQLNIANLEMWAVMVAVKIWVEQLQEKYFWIHVDNQAVGAVLNSGASRDIHMQSSLREISLLAARHKFVIKARHIPWVSNRIPDWLSKFHPWIRG